IHGLSLDPSKFIETCQQVAMQVDATDAEGDRLSYDWKIARAPEGARDLLVPSGDLARFAAATAGEYAVSVTVTDSHAHSAGLSFPLHVAQGAVTTCTLAGRPPSIDDVFSTIAARVPQFGGLYRDEPGQIAVVLTDTSESVFTVAKGAIADAFGVDRFA